MSYPFFSVGDGRKALFLRIDGGEKFANFVSEDVFIDINPMTRDQGSDKPGRSFARAHATRRSAREPTDWHDIEGIDSPSASPRRTSVWRGCAARRRSSSRPRRAPPTCARRFTRT